MNKKVNTLLFILGATLFNVIVTAALFVVLFLLYVKFLIRLLPESGQAWGFPLLFIAAIALSFFVYRFALKLLLKKIQVEKYFDPIFGNGKKNVR
jgi:hypothetical protein